MRPLTPSEQQEVTRTYEEAGLDVPAPFEAFGVTRQMCWRTRNVREAANRVGGNTQVCGALGISESQLKNWIHLSRIPIEFDVVLIRLPAVQPPDPDSYTPWVSTPRRTYNYTPEEWRRFMAIFCAVARYPKAKSDVVRDRMEEFL